MVAPEHLYGAPVANLECKPIARQEGVYFTPHSRQICTHISLRARQEGPLFCNLPTRLANFCIFTYIFVWDLQCTFYYGTPRPVLGRGRSGALANYSRRKRVFVPALTPDLRAHFTMGSARKPPLLTPNLLDICWPTVRARAALLRTCHTLHASKHCLRTTYPPHTPSLNTGYTSGAYADVAKEPSGVHYLAFSQGKPGPHASIQAILRCGPVPFARLLPLCSV